MNVRTMLFTLIGCVGLLGCEESQSTPIVAQDLRPRVRVCTLREGMVFEDALTIQGSVRTKYTAAVASRLPGTIDALFADEGDVVKAGTQLFQVDRVNLENQVAIAKDDEAVAAAARREAEAALAEAKAAFEKAERDAGRFTRLLETGATTADACETAALQLKRATAVVERASAALASADARILQTATARRIAEKNLSDSLGMAPFDGVITKKLQDRGDYADPGEPIFEMDDPRVREVCFTLTADRYAAVEVGKTTVETSFGQTLPITYKAPTVNPISRTFEVRAVLEASEAIAPGMLCDGKICFNRQTAAAVPAAAVSLREGKTVVFVVDAQDIVQAVPVERGWAHEGWVAIQNPEALKGARIVASGMLLLNPGDAVKPMP